MKFFLLIGFPWETEDDLRATEEMIYRAKPNMIAISILNPMPGTKIYRDLEKAGKLVPDFDLENYHYYHCKPAFIHDHFTWDELKAHRDRITDAYLGWFYSPEQFRRRRRDKLAFYLSHPAAALDRVLSGV